MPCTGSTKYPFRMGCTADVGQTLNSTTTLNNLKARNCSMLGRNQAQLILM